MILNRILNWINFERNWNNELNQFGYRTGLPRCRQSTLYASPAQKAPVFLLRDRQTVLQTSPLLKTVLQTAAQKLLSCPLCCHSPHGSGLPCLPRCHVHHDCHSCHVAMFTTIAMPGRNMCHAWLEFYFSNLWFPPLPANEENSPQFYPKMQNWNFCPISATWYWKMRVQTS